LKVNIEEICFCSNELFLRARNTGRESRGRRRNKRNEMVGIGRDSECSRF